MFVFTPTEATFTDNGLGGLMPSDCFVTEDLNGQFELSMTHPVDPYNKYAKLEVGNIITASTHRGVQYFRIYDVDTDVIKGSVVISARHVYYDLLSNFVELVNIDTLDGSDALTAIEAAFQYAAGFTFSSDIAATKSATYTRLNPVQLLMGDIENAFVTVWDGEVLRDNFTIAVNSRIGADNGAKITYRKNMVGLRVTENTKDVVTRIYPICQGAGNTYITLPEKYVDSTNIADYPNPIVAVVKYTDIRVGSDEFPTDTEVCTEMRTRIAALYANGVDLPKLTFTAEMVDLSKTEEYAAFVQTAIALGDDVTVTYTPMSILQKLRVVSVVWDSLKERYKSLTIGDKSVALENHVASVDQDIRELKDQISNDWFDEVAKNIIPCYDSRVAAPVDAYNVAIIQSGSIIKGSGTGKKNIAIGPFVAVSGDNNIAIGDTASTTGTDSIAIGQDATSISNSIVIGKSTSTTGGDNVVIGDSASATGADNVVIGADASGLGGRNTVIGDQASAPTIYNTVIGYHAACATGTTNTVVGYEGLATGTDNNVIGYSAEATGNGNNVLGSYSDSAGNDAVVIGQNASGYANNVIVIGTSSDGYAQDGITIGYDALNNTLGTKGIAIGYSTNNDRASGVCIGNDARSGGTLEADAEMIAIGNSSIAFGNESIAVGNESDAYGDYNTVVGSYARAGAYGDALTTKNTSIGHTATSDGDKNTVIGDSCAAEGDQNTIAGYSGYAVGDNNILIGPSATGEGNNNIVVGDVYATGNNLIKIGYAQTGVVLMDGASDDGMTYNAVAVDKTPLRVKAKASQTANLMLVQDSSGNVVNGFTHEGFAIDIWGGM